MSDPQYFQYNYTRTGGAQGTFDAVGRGDLNGDGNFSTFTLSGKVVSGTVFVAPNIGELNGDE